MISSFHKVETVKRGSARRVVVDVESRPVIVTYESTGDKPRCWVGNARVNPDFVQDVLVGKDPGSAKSSVETEVEPAAEATIDVEAAWHRYDDRYDAIADAEDAALANDELERVSASCRERRNRREKRVLRRSVRRARPVLHDEQGRFAGYGPRKPAPKTGDVSGRKHRNKDVCRYTGRMSRSFLFTPVDWSRDEDPNPVCVYVGDDWETCHEMLLSDMGMVPSDVIAAEESMIWAAEFNDDDEWIEGIMPDYEDVAA